MRKSYSAFGSRLLGVTAVAALSGIAASCSALGDRQFFTASTNQKAIITASADQPLAAPSTGVTRTDLPPPPGSMAAAYPGDTGASYGAAPYATPATSENYAWSAVGGQVITVGAGETLDILAVKYGVPQSQILNANQLSTASQVSPGRTIVIPHRVPVAPGQPQVAQAPQAPIYTTPALPSGPQPIQASGATYTVLTGDTLFSISKKTGTNPDAIIALNGLGSQSQLKNGQILKLPVATSMPANTVLAAGPSTPPKPAPAPVQVASNGALPRIAVPNPAPSATAMGTPPKPAIPSVAGNTQIPPTQASLKPNAAIDPDDQPSANGTTFRWPVRGRVTASFGTSAAGQRNDGINLAVPEGTSVKAAEAGTVIYAGNELEGYGNLILVRHADGWVSAYAHNKDLMVKRGDTVTRGQTIAHAGMTGSVTSPQVHFELRKGSSPVNPLDYLSG
jgi:murein DD-endopeptidase MepM/ murein hydrolase activator NlpD